MMNYLRNWNLTRFVRLAIGVAVVVQGVFVKDWLLVGAGALFSLMPLMNVGCGVNSNCQTNYRQRSIPEDFTYEEIKK